MVTNNSHLCNSMWRVGKAVHRLSAVMQLTWGIAIVTSAALHGKNKSDVIMHSCVYSYQPHPQSLEERGYIVPRSGDKARQRCCKCCYSAILLIHVVLLGYSSLVPKPLVQGYLLLLLVGLCVCASCLQFSRGAEEEGTFSEFEKGTRNLQLLWMNIISTLIKD